jgi:hypothetical protein
MRKGPALSVRMGVYGTDSFATAQKDGITASFGGKHQFIVHRTTRSRAAIDAAVISMFFRPRINPGGTVSATLVQRSGGRF